MRGDEGLQERVVETSGEGGAHRLAAEEQKSGPQSVHSFWVSANGRQRWGSLGEKVV